MKGKLLTLGVGGVLFAGVAWLGTQTEGLVQYACGGLGSLLGVVLILVGFLTFIEAVSLLLGAHEDPPTTPARDDSARSGSPIASSKEHRPAA